MDTFGRNHKLATLDDLDGLGRLIPAGGLEVLNLVDEFVALENLAEDDVAAIEPTKVPC